MANKAAVRKAVGPVLKGCISDDEMYLIFDAKCKDFDIQPTEKLFDRFLYHQAKKPFRKVFDMSCSALGPGSSLMAANILLNTPCLRVINISGNSIGDRGARYFSQLLQETNSIVSLNLSSNSITDKGAELIFLAMCTNKYVISLNLGSDSGVGRNSFGNKACQALNKMLTENKILSELDIAMTEITCDTIGIIAKGIKQNTTLEYLKISNNNIQSKGVNILLKSCIKSQIKTLHIANNQIKDDISASFSNYLEKCRTIESIDLSGNYLTSKFITSVAKQLKSSTLTSLNLNNNPLRGPGVASLGTALTGFSRMRNLSFVNCQVDSRGFGEFCDQLSRNTSLVSLHIGHNPILDEGAIKFSHVVKDHPSLKDVDMEKCEITEEGGRLLFSSFSISPSISRINVKNNLIKNGVIIQKCLTENPRIFYMNADYNTMDYKLTVEIQRLVSENIKRWKSGQKNRVKVKVEELYQVNLELDDTRQSIIEERQFISILSQQFDEMNEEEETIKCRMEATNDELQKKLDELNTIVGGILLESQSKKDDLRSIINQKESEISHMQNRLDNTTQSLKQNNAALKVVEEKIEAAKSSNALEEDDLRIRLENAKTKYNDMRALLEEAWERAREEQKRLRKLREAEEEEEEKMESQRKVKSKAKLSPSKNKNKGADSPNSEDKRSKEKAENNESSRSEQTDKKVKNEGEHKRRKRRKSSIQNTSNFDEQKSDNLIVDDTESQETTDRVGTENEKDDNGELVEEKVNFQSSSTPVLKRKKKEEYLVNFSETSSTNSMATFSSTRTTETSMSKASKSSASSSLSLKKKKLADLPVDGEIKGEIGFENENNNFKISSKNESKQLPKPRSRSVQAASNKNPKIVVPVPNAQKNKKQQNQPRPQVTFQNQIIP